MKTLIQLIVIATLTSAMPLSAQARKLFIIDDFNGKKQTNKIGGGTGCWNYNPQDTSQYCKASFDPKTRIGSAGYSLRLDYDIDTPATFLKEFPNTALNGYFTKLNSIDVSGYSFLVVAVKGNKETGFTRAISIELKDAKQSSPYILEGITDQWQWFAIPLSRFKDITDWTKISELVFSFNENSTRKTGSIFLDSVSFATFPGPSILKAVKAPKKGITIDGDLSEWKKAESDRLDPATMLESGSVADAEDFEGALSFMWDAENLYFTFTATDDQIVSDEQGELIFKGDCIELYIDPANDGLAWGNTKDFQLGFAPSSDGGKAKLWSWLQDVDPSDSIDSAVIVEEKDGTQSYTIEAAIPWEFLGVTPERRMRIGMSVAAHDHDPYDSTEAKLNWCYLVETNNTILGTLELR